MACTTILVGKDASYDGSTIIARNEDSANGEFCPKRFIVVKPEDQPRKYKSVLSHVEIDLPDNPLQYTAVPNADLKEGIWGEAGVNEANVAMSATETLTTNERVLGADPFVELKPAKGKEGEEGFEPEVAIAFGIKRIPWRTPLRILIASYWFSFGVGVVQWLSIHLHIKTLTDYFAHLMYRQYINESSVWGGGRPQFLFAEPSYIGMHLFGVLLPLMWLMRGRDRIYAKRLRNLIVVYAIGAVLMQAGTRIVLDSVVALLVAIIVHNSWCDKKQRVRGVAQLLGAVMLGLLGVLADSRLSSIAENGAEGDGSFFARIYQSLDPICGLLAHPWTVFTGYGSGNIINAVWAGAKHAGRLLNGLGMNGSAAVGFAAGMNADTVWTMCAYTSVVAEYGLIGLVLLVIASIVSMTRVFDTAAAEHGVWSKTVICWLVLIVYLYIQCENYAFAALPLFIFAASKLRK